MSERRATGSGRLAERHGEYVMPVAEWSAPFAIDRAIRAGAR